MTGWDNEPVQAYRLQPGTPYRDGDGQVFVPTAVDLAGDVVTITTDDGARRVGPRERFRRVGSHPLRREALGYQRPADTTAGVISPAAADRWRQIGADYQWRLLREMRQIHPTGSLVGVTLWQLEREAERREWSTRARGRHPDRVRPLD